MTHERKIEEGDVGRWRRIVKKKVYSSKVKEERTRGTGTRRKVTQRARNGKVGDVGSGG